MTVNSILKSGKTTTINSKPFDSRTNLSIKEFNHLKKVLMEHIERKNACKTMASNIYTKELINFWKDEIAEDVLLLQKLNTLIYNNNQKE